MCHTLTSSVLFPRKHKCTLSCFFSCSNSSWYLPDLRVAFEKHFAVLSNLYYFTFVVCRHAKLLQSCPTLFDGSPPGSTVHGILQARILEWVKYNLHLCKWKGWNISTIWGLKVVKSKLEKMNIGPQYRFMDLYFDLKLQFALHFWYS